MEGKMIDVGNGVEVEANGISINDKQNFCIEHNDVMIEMTRDEFAAHIEMGKGILDGDVAFISVDDINESYKL